MSKVIYKISKTICDIVYKDMASFNKEFRNNTKFNIVFNEDKTFTLSLYDDRFDNGRLVDFDIGASYGYGFGLVSPCIYKHLGQDTTLNDLINLDISNCDKELTSAINKLFTVIAHTVLLQDLTFEELPDDNLPSDRLRHLNRFDWIKYT